MLLLCAGLADTGAQWRVTSYDMDSELETMVDSLFRQVVPLYEQLHAYVRRRLITAYPGRDMDGAGPIPAHLLGKGSALASHIKENV